MKVDAGRGKLYDAQKTLRLRWEEAQTAWNDVMRQEFEEHLWEPLDKQTSSLLQAIDRLSQLFSQVRQECSGSEN